MHGRGVNDYDACRTAAEAMQAVRIRLSAQSVGRHRRALRQTPCPFDAYARSKLFRPAAVAAAFATTAAARVSTYDLNVRKAPLCRDCCQ